MNDLVKNFLVILIETFFFHISLSNAQGPKNVFCERWDRIEGTTIQSLLNSSRYFGAANESWAAHQMVLRYKYKYFFGSRHRSYFLALETGNYTFYTSCDDSCRLSQSPDVNPSNKATIVNQKGYVPNGVWKKPFQRSEPQYLKKGHLYYMECLFKQGSSDSHMAVGMTTPSGREEKPIPPKYFRSHVSSVYLPGVDCTESGDDRFPDYQNCTEFTQGQRVNATFEALKVLLSKVVNSSDPESILEDAAASVNLLLSNLNGSSADLQRSNVGFEVARVLEVLGGKIARRLGNASIFLAYPHLEMSGQTVDGWAKFQANGINRTSDQIELKLRPSSGRQRALMIHYKNLHRAVQTEKIAVESDEKRRGYFLNSRIISASLAPGTPGNVLQKVTITLKHTTTKEGSSHEVQCGFWDYDQRSKSSPRGSWSIQGCSRDKGLSNDEVTVCHCNHLTNFAILMRVDESEEDKVNKKALEIITYVGCALSLVGEVLTIIVITSLRLTKSETNVIHLNLVSSLAIAQIIFLAGIEATGHRIACKVVAVFLHYFNLVAFVWMLVEGIWLYIMVVRVFDDGRSRLRRYTACAWGLPFVFVIITLAASFDGYGTEQSCWLSVHKGTIWSFVVPVLLVMISNSVILILVLREIARLHQPTGGENSNDQIASAREVFKSAVVLLPLLGIAWVFGILTFNKETVVFQYLFALFNSLQGFFIFLFFCALNSEVRKAFLRKKQIWSESHALKTHSLTLQQQDKVTLQMADDIQRRSSEALSSRSIGWQ